MESHQTRTGVYHLRRATHTMPFSWTLGLGHQSNTPYGKALSICFDSLGRDATERTFLKVRESLKNTPIIRNKIKLKTHTIRTQRSDECGARMAKYMTNICTDWTETCTSGFSSWLGRLLNTERNDKRNLNRTSRDILKGILNRATEKYKYNKL